MSNTIADNLDRLVTAKGNIADAIDEKGGTVSSDSGFESFPTAIRSIPSGTSIDQMSTDDVDQVEYSSMSTDGMSISPKDLAYISAYVAGNILGDELPSNANLNNYCSLAYEFRSYFYSSAPSGMTGVPSGLTGGFSLKCVHVDVGHFMQILVPYDTSRPRFYIRQVGDSTWSDWKEIADNAYTTAIQNFTIGPDHPSLDLSQNGKTVSFDVVNYKNGVQSSSTTITKYIPYAESGGTSPSTTDQSGVVKLYDKLITRDSGGTGDNTFYDSRAASPLCIFRTMTSASNRGTASDQGFTKLTDTAATSSSASSVVNESVAATPKCVYDSIHNTSNAMPLQTSYSGSDSTTAYTLTPAVLAAAINHHSQLVDFYNDTSSPYTWDSSNKQLKIGLDISYSYISGTVDLDKSSSGRIDIPYGDGTNPGLLKLVSTAQTSSGASGNSDYTAATPLCVYNTFNTHASTSQYGTTQLSSSTSSTSTSLAATPSAVKSAYDLANSAYTAATTSASTSTAGRVQLSTSTSSTSTTMAATPSAVRSAYNLADSAYDLAADAMPSDYFTTVDEVITLPPSSGWTASAGGLYFTDVISESSTFSKILSVTPVTINQIRTTDNLMPVIASGNVVGLRIFSNVNSFKSSSSSITVRIFGIAK